MSACKVHDPKGMRILDFLKKELNLPDNVIQFELHVRLNEIITVRNLDYEVKED